jgi:predicted ATP-binding protein involved in virulence
MSTRAREGTARVDNLFDPFLAITDPTTWLLELDERRFDVVAIGLHTLLDLRSDARLVPDRKTGTVLIQEGRSRDSLRELSDGYQSMLVLSCDVMRTILSLWDTIEQAEGVVLIDELGAHLHPRWRMTIVSRLRTLLPRMQFIVTTHDPLCLRGLEDGEVVVVLRNEARDVVTITDLPPVKGLRVDQLLTSEHFGLGSTVDPELDQLYREYYTLRARARPTAAERSRLAEIDARLSDLEQLGTTERERLMLTAADRFLAQRREDGDDNAPTRADIEDRLLAMWSEKLPAPETRN